MISKIINAKADKISFKRKAYLPSMQYAAGAGFSKHNQAPFLRTIGADAVNLLDKAGSIAVGVGATNYLSNSAIFTGWTLSGTMPRTINYGIAPDGTKTSTLLGATATRQSWLYARRDYSGISEALPTCYSVYVRKPASATSQEFTLLMSNNVEITTQSYWMLRIEGNTIVLKDGGLRATASGDTPRDGGWGYEVVGDGWFRVWCWVLWRNTSTYARTPMVLFYPSISILSTVNDVCEIWNAQVEVGSKPSKPIVTVSATATRAQGVLTLNRKIEDATSTFFNMAVQYRHASDSCLLASFRQDALVLFNVSMVGPRLTLIGATQVSFLVEEGQLNIPFGIVLSNGKVRLISSSGEISAEVSPIAAGVVDKVVVSPDIGRGDVYLSANFTIGGIVADPKIASHYIGLVKNQ